MQKSDKTSADTINPHYLAEVVHELRSPLGGIDAMAELLANTVLSSDQQRLVDGLRTASMHLRAIADDVLDRTAPGNSAFRWQEQPFNLQAFLSAISVAAEARAVAKGLWFIVEQDTDLPEEMIADSRCIRQMIENLIDNAIKVTTTGKVTLSVTVTDRRGVFTGLRFEVRDTGPGFSAMEKERLFKPFSRLDNGVAGSGLGLAMVNRLARAMGGEAECSSTMGEGARFWFTIRVRTSNETTGEGKPGQPDTCLASSTEAGTGSDVILVVDDNKTNRQIMQVMLEHFGYRILEAGSGEQALEILATTPVFAVMLDQTLPGLSGVETLAAIRASGEHWANIPVVPVTGRVSGTDRKAFAKAGATGFVEKPVTARSIRNALELAMQTKTTGHQSVA